MTRRESSWDRLQSRWIAGEALTPAEQSARLEGALSDPRARAELALYREAAGLLDRTVARDDDRQFAERALARARTQGIVPALRGADSCQLDCHVEPRRSIRPEVMEALAARRASKLRRAAAGAVVAAAAAVAAWFGASEFAARHRAASGAPASLARNRAVDCGFASDAIRSNGLEPVPSQQSCRAGDILSTSQDAGCITIDQTIQVCLGRDTRVVLSSLRAARVSIEVAHGVAVAALARRPPGATFSLTSSELSATARGTRYSLEVGSEGAARVSVFEGMVEVRTPQQALLLRPGTHLRRTNTEAHLMAGTVAADEQRRLLALLNAGSSAAASSGSSEPMPMGSARSAELATAPSVAPPRRVTQPRATGPAVSRSSASNRANDAATLFAAARREAARGNTKAALALYRELKSNHAGPSTHPLSVVIGNLELELAGPRRALASFDEYLARGGPLQQEALHGKARALRSLGRPAEERSVIRRYLAVYPTGFHAPTLRKRLAALEAR